MTDGLKNFIERFLGCLIRSHRNNFHWISELIAEIPCVKLLRVVIVADSRCTIERIREWRFNFDELLRVQIESEADLRVSGCR